MSEEKANKSKTVYRKLDEFEDYFKVMVRDKRSFLLHKTTYTRKIKEGNTTIIFNNEGDSDFLVLSLINKTKLDTLDFLKKNGVPRFNKEDIGWYNLTEKPPKTTVTKVDIRGAYWNFALRNKIIKDETNKYLMDNFERSDKLKQARLKALGSLATIKEIHSYVNGEFYETEIKVNKETRDLYIYICKGIDSLMKEVTYEIPGAFFYYWDCVFSDENTSQDVIDYIIRQKYEVKSQCNTIDIVDIGQHKYLFTKEDNKMYLIKPEQKHLLYV